MRIKKAKLKRKAHNFVLKAITAGAVTCTIIAPIMYAFYKPLLIYAVLFFLGIGWCMTFIQANGGGRNV